MTRATLTDVLTPALAQGYAVAGVVCLGWEDARAYTRAAELEGLPIILQAGPGARAHMPISVWGVMFGELAESVSVPVVSHLDHGTSLEECAAAIATGFSSVMFDGSALPLSLNIARTAEIAEMAHAAGVSCEGEIGYVGYADGAKSRGTDPEEAARFAQETGIDAMAISIGNVHLQQEKHHGLDRNRLAAIEALCDIPLVIHGGSGVPVRERQDLARMSKICKFNIGTELRMGFGAALSHVMSEQPAEFDRIKILGQTEEALVALTRPVLRALKP